MHLNDLARVLRTVGEERRIRIVCHLMRGGESCVSDIARELRMSMATTSHHLHVMAKDGLVVSARDGKRMCYALPSTPMMRSLRKFICAHVEM